MAFDPSNAGPIWSILGPLVAQLMGGTPAGNAQAAPAQDPFQAFIQQIIGQLVPTPQAQAASIPPAAAPAGLTPSFTQQLLQNLGWTQGSDPRTSYAAYAKQYQIPMADPNTPWGPSTAGLMVSPTSPQAYNIAQSSWVPNPGYQPPPQREPSQK